MHDTQHPTHTRARAATSTSRGNIMTCSSLEKEKRKKEKKNYYSHASGLSAASGPKTVNVLPEPERPYAKRTMALPSSS